MPEATARRGQRDDSEEERPTISTMSADEIQNLLRPQPLGKAQAPNLRRLVNDFRQQTELIAETIRLLIETAEQTAEAHNNDPENEFLLQADLDLRELIDLQEEKIYRQAVLTEMMQELDAGIEMSNPTERYTTAVQAKMDKYAKLTARQKYAQNADYHNLRDALWSATNEGAMPPVRDLIPAEEGDDEGSDDDIAIGGATQNFRCPITTLILEDPVTNSVCNHSYSRSAIYEFLRTNSQCPSQGCPARVSARTLQPNPTLARKVATFKRREEERELTRRQQNTILE